MVDSAEETFRQKRREIDTALAALLDGLDREHYPVQLIGLLAAALQTGQALRGLPLLLGVISGPTDRQPSIRALSAFECCLRAFLLTAELALEGQGRPAGGVGGKLGEKFTRAQVLLTADTLFTWPLELAAEESSLDGKPLSVELAAALGAGGGLAALDQAGGQFEGLLGLEPLDCLCRAWAGQRAQGFRAAAKWVYLLELSRWFGNPPGMGRALGKLEEEMSVVKDINDPRKIAVAELILFLKA